MERNFALTNGALKDLATKCPSHDIDKVGQLFDTTDTVERLNNMAWFICVLNKWGEKRANGTFEGALTMDDIDAMEFDEIEVLFTQAMRVFKGDATPKTEVEPTSKKEEAAPRS